MHVRSLTCRRAAHGLFAASLSLLGCGPGASRDFASAQLTVAAAADPGPPPTGEPTDPVGSTPVPGGPPAPGGTDRADAAAAMVMPPPDAAVDRRAGAPPGTRDAAPDL